MGVVNHLRQERHFVPTLNKDMFEVCWISTREEPVLYINGMPYVLRESETPFTNIKHLKGEVWLNEQEFQLPDLKHLKLV